MESALLNGLVGGLVATVVMTIFMMVLGGDDPPPTAQFWSKYIGSEGPESYLPQGMALHFLYGIGAGGAFGLALELGSIGFSERLLVLGLGVAFGILLFAFAAVFWMKVVLALKPEPKQIGLFLTFHLIYGVVLGFWMGFELLL